MATANLTKKFQLPPAKVLRFTLSGKSIPEELASMEDERRVRTRLGDELYARYKAQFSSSEFALLMRAVLARH